MPSHSQQLVPAVDRAIRMLASLRDDGNSQRISDLARALSIPKSSAFQIAATLVHHGFLERDEDTRRYRLGPGLLDMAGGVATAGLLPLAGPYLEELARTTRTTALLGVPAKDSVILAAKAESPEPVGITAPLGHRLDQRSGVFGKLFAADLGERALSSFLKGLPRFTARSITDARDYRRDLRRVRERGYALDVEEYLEGVRAVGAPVRDRGGRTVAAICLLGLSSRLKRPRMKQVGEQVRDAAVALSAHLGHVDHGTAEDAP